MRSLHQTAGAALNAALLLLAPSQATAQKATPYTCSFWHAAEFIPEGQEVRINAIAGFSAPTPLPGIGPKHSTGAFRFGNGVELVALVDPPLLGAQTFIIPAGRKVIFRRDPVAGDFGPPVVEFADSFSGALPRIALQPQSLNPPLRCIRQAGMPHLVEIPDEAAGRGLAKTEPPRTPGPPPTSIREKLGRLVSTPAAVPPVIEVTGSLQAAIDAALTEREPDAKKEPVSNSESVGKPDAAEEPEGSLPAAPIEDDEHKASTENHAAARAACTSSMEALALGEGFAESSVTVAGLRNDATLLNAYVFDPVAGDPLPHSLRLDLSDSKGQLLPLAMRAGGRAPPLRDATDVIVIGDEGEPVRITPVRFAHIESVPVLLQDGTRIETGPPVIRILVVGDAPSVAITGLADVEQELSKTSSGYRWRFTWHETRTDGTLADGVEFSTLTELEAHAATRTDADKALLSRSDKFERFTHQLTRRMTTSEDRIDYVLWIQEGYPLPNNAPLKVETMLKDVAEHGNVPRFPNGKPEKWLTVINGRILGTTKPYLDNPLKYADPTPQSLLEEDAATAPRRLLSRIEPVVNSLRLIGERSKTSEATNPSPLADETIVIDARQGFQSVGLLLDAEGADKLFASARAVQNALQQNEWNAQGAFERLDAAYDLGVLISIYSSSQGVPEGLTFDPAELRLLEKRLGSATAVDFIKSISEINETLPAVSQQMRENGCEYLYLTSEELGLNWQRTE
jgi:hypothetical protein